MNHIRTIAPMDLANLQAEGGLLHLIDVRDPNEFAEVHALPAINLPIADMTVESLEGEFGVSREDPIYLICRTGKRSQGACERVSSLGFHHVFNVMGGTDEWAKAGLPIRRSS